MKQFDSLSAVMPEGQQQLIPSPLQQLHFQSPKSPSVFLVFESQTIARQTHISTGEVTKKNENVYCVLTWKCMYLNSCSFFCANKSYSHMFKENKPHWRSS